MKDDWRVRDLMEHDCRTRLAETCGTRDESPRSNLGRGKQGEAIRADIISPQVDDRGPKLMSSRKHQRRTSTEADEAEQEGERDMTRCCDHGVPWKHRAQTVQRGENQDNSAKHNERWLQWRQFAQ